MNAMQCQRKHKRAWEGLNALSFVSSVFRCACITAITLFLQNPPKNPATKHNHSINLKMSRPRVGQGELNTISLFFYDCNSIKILQHS